MDNYFVYYFETDDFHLKYAQGEPFLKDKEFHNYHEFLIFLEGKSYFISKNIQQELTPGSIVLIPKEQFHQFRISDSDKYKRCVLGFSETSEIAELIKQVMTEVKIIYSPNNKITNLYKDLFEIIKSELDDNTKKLYIKASLIQFLVYFKESLSSGITQNINISPVVLEAINYIDNNFNKKISVNSIAKNLYIAPSTLAHKFSKELNITVYQYISKKRINSVEKLVKEGYTYSEAALKSGFYDYSSFYRMYKKSSGN